MTTILMARTGTRHMKQACSAHRRGIGLLEVGLALAVMAMATLWFAETQFRASQTARTDASATRLATVRIAAQSYLDEHWLRLAELAPVGGGPVAVPVGRASPRDGIPEGPGGLPSLQGGGFLPPIYVDRNAYGQGHVLLVRQVENERLEGMVAAIGGQAIPDADLGRLAQKVGPFGGFVAGNPLPGNPADAILGTFGGWRSSLADWRAGGIGPSAGRPVAMLDGSAAGIAAELAQEMARKVGRQAVEATARPGSEGAAELRDSAALLRQANDLLRRRLEEQRREDENTACGVFGLCAEP